MTDHEADECDLWTQATINALLYGNGFIRVFRNEQGVMDSAIVPIEDYKYIKIRDDGLIDLNYDE